MVNAMIAGFEPSMPSPADSKAASEAVRRLDSLIRKNEPLRLAPGQDGGPIELPPVAAELLLRLLRDLAAGHTVTLIPIHAELTTQSAADLLGVSRPFIIKLLEDGRLPHRLVGTHRRILFKDLMEYRKTMESGRRAALQQLADEAQEHGLGY